MIDENGGIATPTIEEDWRTYLPFRYLGDALGIPVYYDPVTNEGIYNFVPVPAAADDF